MKAWLKGGLWGLLIFLIGFVTAFITDKNDPGAHFSSFEIYFFQSII